MACCGKRIEFILVAGLAGAAIGFGGSRLCSTYPNSAGTEASILPAAYQPDEEKNAKQEGADDQMEGHQDAYDKEMQEWMALGTPGEHHEMLKDMVGTWNAECTWTMGPEGESQHWTGQETIELIFGGRYTRHTFECETEQGPYSAIGFTAYDNGRGEYVGIWLDSMSTSIMMTHGNMEDGQLVMRGEFAGPEGRTVKMRHVIRHIDNDHTVFEMYSDEGQGERKVGQIEYTRVK